MADGALRILGTYRKALEGLSAMKPKRILYHHRTLGDGAEGIHIHEMIKAFRGLGHVVEVIGPVGERASSPSARPSKLAGIKRAMPGLVFELAEIAYTGYCFAQTLLRVWRFRPDFIYDRYITFNAGPVLAGKMARVPVLLEVNAPLALERTEQKDEKLYLRRIANWMEHWICALSWRTIVVSSPLRDYLRSIGVPAEHCVVMPNGADPDTFRPRAKSPELLRELAIPDSAFVVGFTGVLRGWHGLDLLVEAIAELEQSCPDVCVLIVGDGPYRGELEALAAARGISARIRITGRIPHEQVPDYVALFDAAVSPRATFYASPMKVIEYMSLEKAVIVPDTANFLDMVDDQRNGMVFRDGDAGSMSAVIQRLYLEPEFAAGIARQARLKVEQRLNWTWNAKACCDLVDSRNSLEPTVENAGL